MSNKNIDDITLLRIRELKGNDSQETFAQKISSTQSNVSKMLNGAPPSAATLKALSETYQVSVDWLLGLSDIKELGNKPKFYELDADKLTYADVIAVLDALFHKNAIKIGISRDGFNSSIDSSSLDIVDRVLQYLLENHMRYIKGSKDIYDIWIERAKEHFSNLPLMEWNDENIMLYDGNSPSTLCDAEIIKIVDAIQKTKPLQHTLEDIKKNIFSSMELPFN